MSTTENLYQSFTSILESIETTYSRTVSIHDKIERFSKLYTVLVKDNHTKTLLFCLDSLYFQYRLAKMNFDGIENMSKYVLNRMYGDYFRLYKLIVADVCEKHILDLSTEELYPDIPQYRDLDVFQIYATDDIAKVHCAIIGLLQKLNVKWELNKQGIEEYIENHVGILSISNYLNTLKYENELLYNQVQLYSNYMTFFHVSQRRMLSKIVMRLECLEDEIEGYLKFNRILTVDDLFIAISSRPSTPMSAASDPTNTVTPASPSSFSQGRRSCVVNEKMCNQPVVLDLDFCDSFWVGDVEIPVLHTNTPVNSDDEQINEFCAETYE